MHFEKVAAAAWFAPIRPFHFGTPTFDPLMILTMTMVLFTSVAIVRERERGNMELLIATPIIRSELMVGKVLPYVAIGLVQTSQ